MSHSDSPASRRAFLGAMAAGFFTTRGLFAEMLEATPRLTEGPFYPNHLPLDRDNDLIIIGNNTTPALGEITQLSGRILTAAGEPINNATIEIWQCDANSVYLHTNDSSRKQNQIDRNFQGFGSFLTGTTGEYRFRTIKPVPYPGRPAGHIHIKVKQGIRELLTTQLMVRGAPGNKQDHIFMDAGGIIERELIQADFLKIPDSRTGELFAKFDIVIGRTPDDRPRGERVSGGR